MRSQFLLYLIFLILLSSCHKKEVETVRFSGIVIDAKDNLPMPNVLTKIYLDIYHPTSQESFMDSTWTDNDGFYDMSLDCLGHTSYSIYSYKDGYLTELLNSTVIKTKPIGNSITIIDTITIWRTATLKIDCNIIDYNWTYVINKTIDRPIETIDSLRFFQPRSYEIDTSIYPQELILTFLYDFNHQVNISWYKYNPYFDTIFNEEIRIIDLVPLDTTFINLELE